jgi:hypothetical protein
LTVNTQHEHELEPIPGLPEALPPGETILWQGRPDGLALARRAFHARGLALYFGVILLVRLALLYSNPQAEWTRATFTGFIVLSTLAALAIGILCTLAWLVSRTTLYTITNRRVVLRIGVVLCITFNLPFSAIERAGLRTYSDGTGDIPLTLKSPNKIAFFHLWPHARPWHLTHPQPMLRAIPEAARVGEILALACTAELPGIASRSENGAPAESKLRGAPGRPRAVPAGLSSALHS